jgi:hypothetical protein
VCTELVKAACSASVQTRNRRARPANLARRKPVAVELRDHHAPIQPNYARYTTKLLIHRSENLRAV